MPAESADDRLLLWAHLVSAHAGIYGLRLSLDELTEIHDDEHDGPGTIRNHPRSSRKASLKKISAILAEVEEDPDVDSAFDVE